jgi:hypothetical protein
MTTLNVQSHALAKTDIFYLVTGHFYGEDRRDITIVLDRDDMLELLSYVDTGLYDKVSIETEGDYFYVTSSVQGSFFIIENTTTEYGTKDHEGDILILPHYVPHAIRQHCINGSEKVIEIALESIYEKLVKIIES